METDFLKILSILLERLGNITLSEAKTWLEVEENAQSLKREAESEIVEGK
jgi:hypothetical protein